MVSDEYYTGGGYGYRYGEERLWENWDYQGAGGGGATDLAEVEADL